MLSKLRRAPAYARRARDQRALSEIARNVRERNLTYLSPSRLRTLEDLAKSAVPGDFLECGVALGGSAIVLARHGGSDRRFHGYDVFGMIPPPGENDPPEAHERYQTIVGGESSGLGGEEYYGYRDDLYEQVSAAFSEFGVPVDGDRVQLHRGLFEDTLHPDSPVALAHVDSDWYDPVKTCLERIYPQLEAGGVILLDDYEDYGGCKQATDEFMSSRPDLRLEPQRGGNVALVRS
jgi:asparagine synthase (glutamine-hydrolysing)